MIFFVAEKSAADARGGLVGDVGDVGDARASRLVDVVSRKIFFVFSPSPLSASTDAANRRAVASARARESAARADETRAGVEKAEAVSVSFSSANARLSRGDRVARQKRGSPSRSRSRSECGSRVSARKKVAASVFFLASSAARSARSACWTHFSSLCFDSLLNAESCSAMASTTSATADSILSTRRDASSAAATRSEARRATVSASRARDSVSVTIASTAAARLVARRTRSANDLVFSSKTRAFLSIAASTVSVACRALRSKRVSCVATTRATLVVAAASTIVARRDSTRSFNVRSRVLFQARSVSVTRVSKRAPRDSRRRSTSSRCVNRDSRDAKRESETSTEAFIFFSASCTDASAERSRSARAAAISFAAAAAAAASTTRLASAERIAARVAPSTTRSIAAMESPSISTGKERGSIGLGSTSVGGCGFPDAVGKSATRASSSPTRASARASRASASSFAVASVRAVAARLASARSRVSTRRSSAEPSSPSPLFAHTSPRADAVGFLSPPKTSPSTARNAVAFGGATRAGSGAGDASRVALVP